MAPRRPPLDQAQIVAWYTAGWTIQRIAQQLGVHHQDISVVLDQAGVVRQERVRKVDAALLRQLYEDMGWTVADIAAVLNVAKNTVWRALRHDRIPRRRGVRRDRARLTPDQQAALQRAIRLYGAPKVLQIFQERDSSIRSVQMIYGLADQSPKPRGTRRKVDDAAVRTAYLAGHTVITLAQQWHCHVRTIQRSLQRTCTHRPDNDNLSDK